MKVALILSGGIGSRLASDVPKQYIEVCGKPIIAYCIETISAHEDIDAIQIVADEKWQEVLEDWVNRADVKGKFKGFSRPGDNRQLSIYNGLKDIETYASDTSVVMVHDAARPLLSSKMISDCFQAMEGYDGVLPVLPMKDTVYASADGKAVSALLNRSEIFAGQAPECFLLDRYLQANEMLLPDMIKKINGSTEPAIMAGMHIAMIPGDERNFKITTQSDLERFRQIVQERTE